MLETDRLSVEIYGVYYHQSCTAWLRLIFVHSIPIIKAEIDEGVKSTGNHSVLELFYYSQYIYIYIFIYI